MLSDSNLDVRDEFLNEVENFKQSFEREKAFQMNPHHAQIKFLEEEGKIIRIFNQLGATLDP